MANKRTIDGTTSGLISDADMGKAGKVQNALFEIADAVSALTDMQTFYAALHRIVGELMIAKSFYISLYDPVTQILSSPYFADEAGDAPPPPTRLAKSNKSLRGYVLHSGKTLHVSAQEIDEGKLRGKFTPMGTPAEDWIGVPLKVDGQVIGSLTIQSYEKGVRYDEQDVQVLEFVAQHIAIALTRARAIDETRQRNAELQIINSVQSALAAKLDMQGIYEVVGDKIREIFHNADMSIRIHDAKTNLLHYPYTYEKGQRISIEAFPLPERGFGPQVLRTHKSLMINENIAQEIKKRRSGIVPGTLMSKSLIMVPLMASNQAFGLITLNDMEHEHAFTEADVRLLETLANSMSVALENARLFDEIQKRNHEITEALEQQTATSDVLRSIAGSPTDIQPVLDSVVENAARLSNSNEATIFRINADGLMQVAAYFGDDLTVPFGSTFPIDHNSIAGRSIIEKTVIHVPDFEKVEHEYPLSKSVHKTRYRAFLAVPLEREGQCIGVIFIRRSQPVPFTEKQIILVNTFADQASIAIENVRLFDESQRLLKETEQRAAELAVINSVQAGLASKLDFHAIIDLVGDTIRDIFNVQSMSIGIYDHGNKIVDYSYVLQKDKRVHYDPMPFSGVTKHIVRTHKILVVNNNVKSRMGELGSHWADGETPQSLLYVPIIAGEITTGVVAIYDYDRENAFSNSDIRLLQTLVNAMSIALENARLWEQEKLYRKALERELEIGREIQAGFLPEALPLIEGWEIAAMLRSAREVAGDFYDAFQLPDGTIGLVIADVCDKGVGAALFMTLFRSLLRMTTSMEFFQHTGDTNPPLSPAMRLQRAISLTNNYIAETHGESGMFATLFFGILEPRDGTLTYINAGHEPPLIVQSGSVHQILSKTGPAVGVLEDCHFDLLETQMGTGDLLIGFTDGVPDAQNQQGEFFSRQRVLDLLGVPGMSAYELVKTIDAQIRHYIGTAIQFDDITLLVVRWAGISQI